MPEISKIFVQTTDKKIFTAHWKGFHKELEEQNNINPQDILRKGEVKEDGTFVTLISKTFKEIKELGLAETEEDVMSLFQLTREELVELNVFDYKPERKLPRGSRFLNQLNQTAKKYLKPFKSSL